MNFLNKKNIINYKKYAAIFPGQGIQFIGMLSSLYNNYEIIKKTFNYASEILEYDLWNLIQYGSLKKLNKTYHTQPAILTSSIAIYKLWLQKNNNILLPNIVMGYSLGEYTAMVCSNIINFSDAIKIVRFRGKLMHKLSSNLKDYNKNGYYMQTIIGIKKK
ncbi:acyltransferase domain-containing protein [Enterobacteriaceae endosymbiont of Donacia versicolorea]|uniref:ACP S-malonyltransferase n=1 Tax=Enterobacteriaceae endosymbiont of Donacia versicolorea TaxID=2675788 RepID=UPI0014498A2B|nr:acyltransferase domain-containing protein [Enterobacteriaceae endosymbiont of Donacia versicolorea]QJC31960.1 acyltransferase domain-containing protein [Enterobacteriaceae endosymbiont of Donacia versicolorea]